MEAMRRRYVHSKPPHEAPTAAAPQNEPSLMACDVLIRARHLPRQVCVVVGGATRLTACERVGASAGLAAPMRRAAARDGQPAVASARRRIAFGEDA
jgi:hypothetical protein